MTGPIAALTTIAPEARTWILQSISRPEVALLLVLAGILCVYVEFCGPGRVLPGVLGGVFILCGCSALSSLPLQPTGLALIALAIVTFAFVFVAPGGWRIALTAAGAFELARGMTGLARPTVIHSATAWSLAVPFACITTFLLSSAARARRNKKFVGGSLVG